MLRLIGIFCLMLGCIGMGCSIRERMKRRLEQLYQIRQMMKMFQSEISYSHVPWPEACRRISRQVEAPYREALADIYEQMRKNTGQSLAYIWKQQMEKCIRESDISKEEGRILYELGASVGFIDSQMQSELIEQLIDKLKLVINRREEELANKCRVVMSLSVMGGMMLAIILI